MSGQTTVDPVIAAIREELTALDERIVALVNERVVALRRIRARKAELGIDLYDPQRESQLLRHLQEVNGGPLSAEGLEELHAFVLGLCKSEASR
jgi:chorismate mutase